MKFALVNGQRQEPQPKLSGDCPCCGDPMIAKCGKIRTWHWAHKRKCVCDPWWENETDWHRDWKDQFPRDWQEIIHFAEDGERHIADVKTDDDWVIEFQHSKIDPEERQSREAFYSKLVWVVDGLKRESDKARFFKTWKEGTPLSANSPVQRVWSGKGALLLRDWVGGRAHIFFDFGDEQVLWWLSPESEKSWVYVAPFPRAKFIEVYRQTETRRAREREFFRKNYSACVEHAMQSRAESLADAEDLLRFLRIERGDDYTAPRRRVAERWF